MRNAWPFLALLLSIASPAQALDCRAGQQPTLTAELFFGRNTGQRHAVGDAAWSRFLAAEITPRFPAGLTVVDATGQWRDRKRNTLVRERSKLVLVTLRPGAADQARIDAIVAAYKRRFHQQSVAVLVRPACISF
jgi:Protein of unknown function (DUF3574)